MGKCQNYNNVDDVWSFAVKGCTIKGNDFQDSSESCRIVTLDAALNPKTNFERK